MISTGNDIVSLCAVDITRTKQPRFYSKILSDAESLSYHQQLATALPFENYVWLLWSIKESAFKFLQRTSLAMLFTPVELVVEQLQMPANSIAADFGVNELTSAGFDAKHTINATVTSGSNKIYSRSFIYPDLIMTVVNQTESFDNIYWGIQWIDDEHHHAQSIAVREFLFKNIRSLTGYEYASISKNAHGIPVLLNGTEELNIPVSLSHHGHFIAYAFNLQ